jgi:protein-S-isoprenylcysteine O-methyltransferase Ste14
MLQIIALSELLVCWVAWVMAFVEPRKQASQQKEVAKAPASRWGLFLVMLSFACIWAYVRPEGFHKSTFALVASMILAPPSMALSWWATRHLGKQWRFQAALSEGHELIQTGPYRWIRHPIYTSMLGMLLATGAAWTWMPLYIAAICFFIAGTEIRIRAEDRLLAGHFGANFEAYRSHVRAYIPFVR